jgi:hypothetical protein
MPGIYLAVPAALAEKLEEKATQRQMSFRAYGLAVLMASLVIPEDKLPWAIPDHQIDTQALTGRFLNEEIVPK